MKTGILIAIITWAVATGISLSTPAPEGDYDYHMAYNEAWYTRVHEGTQNDPFMPPGLAATAHFIPVGDTVQKLRVVSILSSLALVGVTYWAFGPVKASVVATLPWLVVWGTRAQTDAAMTALAFIGLIVARKAGGNVQEFLGGVVSGFATFYKPVAGAVLLAHNTWTARIGFLVGTLPFLTWVKGVLPTFTSFHANHAAWFENALPTILGTILGLGILSLSIVARQFETDRGVWAATATWGLFAFAKAPYGHEYYLLPALVGVALLWRPNPERLPLITGVNSAIALYATGALFQ